MTTADSTAAAALALEYADAWNACDAVRLLELLHPEFRMHRMKGDVIDREGVRDAVARQRFGTAMKLFPRRCTDAARGLLSPSEWSTAMSRTVS